MCALLRPGFILLLASCAPLAAQIPYATSPEWESTDIESRSIGLAWVDIDNDGWLDLLTANGGDDSRQALSIYMNDGAGVLERSPSWQSDEREHHAHVTIGDVNNDGWSDVAVSVYLGEEGYESPGLVRLYLNREGVLESSASWESEDRMYSFACSFGDADNDGDLDLAVASGEVVHAVRERSRIYYNQDGELNRLPQWRHQAHAFAMDAAWADFDQDGDLDPAFVYQSNPNRIFGNFGDRIGKTTVWFSQDRNFFAHSVYITDVTGDALPDMIVSNNGLAGGAGYHKMYYNGPDGLNRTPNWESEIVGEGTGIVLFDVNRDGFADLISCGWDRPVEVYINQAGKFIPYPQWHSTTRSTAEALAIGDVDNDGLESEEWSFDLHPEGRNVFTTPRQPFRRIVAIELNGEPLPLEDYCYSAEQGWLSIDKGHKAGRVRIRAEYSLDLDLAVSNWDADKGNYVFNYSLQRSDLRESVRGLGGRIRLAPNPASEFSYLYFDESLSGTVQISVSDLLGRIHWEGRRQHSSNAGPVTAIPLGGLTKGTYTVRLADETEILSLVLFVR